MSHNDGRLAAFGQVAAGRPQRIGVSLRTSEPRSFYDS
jgi:hypothetical protein